MSERESLEHRLSHARGDLDELAEQVAEGEIDEATAARLRASYEEEEANVETALRSLPEEPAKGRAAKRGSPRAGRIAGIAVGIVMVITAVIVVVILMTGDGGSPAVPPTTAPDLELTGDITDMEAAVAAHPESNGLRLALAGMYFEQSDYLSAMPHYLAVLENAPTPQEESLALAHIGWMAYITEQLDAATDYLTSAVILDPANGDAHLWLGITLLYGLEDAEAAIPVFEALLELPDLPSSLRPEVENMLADARAAAGEG